MCDPAHRYVDRRPGRPAFGMELGKPIENALHLTMPVFALQAGPIVKGWGIVERKAFEEIATVDLYSRLQLGERFSRGASAHCGIEQVQVEVEIGFGVE